VEDISVLAGVMDVANVSVRAKFSVVVNVNVKARADVAKTLLNLKVFL
jgi:hypothetical protein